MTITFIIWIQISKTHTWKVKIMNNQMQTTQLAWFKIQISFGNN